MGYAIGKAEQLRMGPTLAKELRQSKIAAINMNRVSSFIESVAKKWNDVKPSFHNTG